LDPAAAKKAKLPSLAELRTKRESGSH
jgi:hypothetical protein